MITKDGISISYIEHFKRKLFEECERCRKEDGRKIILVEKEYDSHKIGYILSSMESELLIDGAIHLVDRRQVRLDDLGFFLRSLKCRFVGNPDVKRLVALGNKELYVCKRKSDGKITKLFEILPLRELEKKESSWDYKYEKKEEELHVIRVFEFPKREIKKEPREVKYLNRYTIYGPLLNILLDLGIGIYEVEYDSNLNLQDIIDGKERIGFRNIYRIFP